MKLLPAVLLLLALPLVLPAAPAAPQAWVCTDIPYDDACASTLCFGLTSPTTYCSPRSVCVVGETRCIGSLACVKAVCVPDPCYTTACTVDASLGWPVCVVLIDQPDLGYKLCVDRTTPDCLVYIERTTFIGTDRICLVPP